jgi:hypothetical protein
MTDMVMPEKSDERTDLSDRKVMGYSPEPFERRGRFSLDRGNEKGMVPAACFLGESERQFTVAGDEAKGSPPGRCF